MSDDLPERFRQMLVEMHTIFVEHEALKVRERETRAVLAASQRPSAMQVDLPNMVASPQSHDALEPPLVTREHDAGKAALWARIRRG